MSIVKRRVTIPVLITVEVDTFHEDDYNTKHKKSVGDATQFIRRKFQNYFRDYEIRTSEANMEPHESDYEG